MDILHEEEIDIICLVSSDSDFTKLAYRIKESGKYIIGMGEQKANEAIVQACDEFKMLDLIYNINIEGKDNDNGGIEAGMFEASAENGEVESVPLEEEDSSIVYVPTESEIVENIKEILDDDWENLANVGAILKKQRPGFDTRIYRCKNMKQFIENHGDVFDIKVELAEDQIHKIVFVKLKS